MQQRHPIAMNTCSSAIWDNESHAVVAQCASGYHTKGGGNEQAHTLPSLKMRSHHWRIAESYSYVQLPMEASHSERN